MNVFLNVLLQSFFYRYMGHYFLKFLEEFSNLQFYQFLAPKFHPQCSMICSYHASYTYIEKQVTKQ